MPKPRTLSREQRRIARDLATRHALAALAALRPAGVPDLAQAAYRRQIDRCYRWVAKAGGIDLARAGSPPLARGDSGGTDEPG